MTRDLIALAASGVCEKPDDSPVGSMFPTPERSAGFSLDEWYSRHSAAFREIMLKVPGGSWK